MIKLFRNSDKFVTDLFKVNKQNPNVEYCSARAYKIDMKIIDYIGFGKNNNIDKNKEILKYFGISDVNQKMNEIERSKRQIVHLIASFTANKKTYYFVEPTINLDNEDVNKFLTVIATLNEMDKEIVLITDDLRLINKFTLNPSDLVDSTDGFVIKEIESEKLPFTLVQEKCEISRLEICKVFQLKPKLYLNLLFFVTLIMLFVMFLDALAIDKMIFENSNRKYYVYITLSSFIFLILLWVINQFRKKFNNDLEAEYIRYFSVKILDDTVAKMCNLQINLLVLLILWISGSAGLNILLFEHKFITLFHVMMVIFISGKIIGNMRVKTK